MCVSALGARMAMAGPPYDDPVARFPEKTALRLLNDRAPQLETPWRYFREDLTPNDAMFVRWHLQPMST
jgi:sulfite dehydrogenase